MKNILIYSILLFCVSCTTNNINEDDSLKKYFDENNVTGTFGMFDNGQAEFTIYNVVRYSDSVYLPASTFKIVNSLIGIQTGKVNDDSAVIKWDSISRGRPECNKDMMMLDAFRISCPPWYMELARRIGKDTMQHWLDTLGYGAKSERFQIKKIIWILSGSIIRQKLLPMSNWDWLKNFTSISCHFKKDPCVW